MTVRYLSMASGLLLAGACGGGGSGGGPTDPPPPPVGSVEVAYAPDYRCAIPCSSIRVGSVVPLIAVVKGTGGEVLPNETVLWSSSSDSVLTVSPEGVVTGRGSGEADAVATLRGVSGSMHFWVSPARVTRVQLEPSTLTLNKGELSSPFVATAFDAEGRVVADASLSWSVANPLVASLEGAESVRATGAGRTLLSVAAEGAYPGVGGYSSATIEVLSADPPRAALDVTRLSVGGSHVCALGTLGKPYCWGWNFDGQLGTGSLGARSDFFPVPQPVAFAGTFTSVSTGMYHSCGLTAEGTAWCWGSNGDGTVGVANGGNSVPAPVPVSGSHVFTAVAPGAFHTCALSPTKTGSYAFCWGGAAWGVLGSKTSGISWVPLPVDGGHTFVRIVTGLWTTCALGSTGVAWCWGFNDHGELGAGLPGATVPFSDQPVQVAADVPFVDLDVSRHGCALTAAGDLYCWGNNESGQLGELGGALFSDKPVLVALGLGFTSVTTGAHHTCALDADGAAWCWGNNEYGQLGDGTLAYRSSPVPVLGDRSFVSITAGNVTTCAVTSEGKGYCWGGSSWGQLGGGEGFAGGDFFSPEPWPIAPPSP